jgi:hypothetical protein
MADYDRSAPTRHDYLPERDDLRQDHVLQYGQEYKLPVIWLGGGSLLLPKQLYPLLLSGGDVYNGNAAPAVGHSLRSPRPYTGYVACGVYCDELALERINRRCMYMCVAFICQRAVSEEGRQHGRHEPPIPSHVVLRGIYRYDGTYTLMPSRPIMCRIGLVFEESN